MPSCISAVSTSAGGDKTRGPPATVTVSNILCPPSWPTAPTESKDSSNAAVVHAARSPRGYIGLPSSIENRRWIDRRSSRSLPVCGHERYYALPGICKARGRLFRVTYSPRNQVAPVRRHVSCSPQSCRGLMPECHSHCVPTADIRQPNCSGYGLLRSNGGRGCPTLKLAARP